MKKIRTSVRSSSGATVVVVAIVAFFIILPLGLFSFELARLYLAQNQLQNAVDAAALAGLQGLSDGNLQDAPDQALSLALFQQNQITGSSLSSAKLSASAATDTISVAGNSNFNLAIDHAKNQVATSAAFGYLPAFANSLNLGTVTIHANALAGSQGGVGDIVIAIDYSDSIKAGCGVNNQPDGQSSKSLVVTRHANYKGTVPKYTYTTITKKGPKNGPPTLTIPINIRHSHSPTGLHVGGNFLHAIPDPAQINWASSSNTTYQKFATKTLEEQVALLVESKQGHLDALGDKNSYDPTNNVDKYKLGSTALAAYLPGIGDGTIAASNNYISAYEEQALPFVHPLADEKRDIQALIKAIVQSNPNANIALVGFAPRAGGHFSNPGPTKKGQPPPQPKLPPEQGVVGTSYGYAEAAGFNELATNSTPVVPFLNFTAGSDYTQHNSNVLQAVAVGTTFAGTNTTDALNVSHALLTQDQRNLKGQPQACFLLSDGIPTVGGYLAAAKKFKADGIPIITIGYTNTGYAHGAGAKVLTKIYQNGGPGGHYIPAPYISQAAPGQKSFVGYYDPNDSAALSLAFSGPPGLIHK